MQGSNMMVLQMWPQLAQGALTGGRHPQHCAPYELSCTGCQMQQQDGMIN